MRKFLISALLMSTAMLGWSERSFCGSYKGPEIDCDGFTGKALKDCQKEMMNAASGGNNKGKGKGDKEDKDCSEADDTTTYPGAMASCTAAKSACNLITPQQQALISAALNTAKSAMSGVASTDAVALDKSAADTCKVGAAMSAIAGAATLALAVDCQLKVSACNSSNAKTGNPKNAMTAATAATATKPAAEAVPDEGVASNRAYCSGLETNVLADGLQALTYAMSFEQNTQCAAVYDAAAAAAVPKTCQEEPTRPDCICIINPNDPSCLGQTAGLSASTGFSDSSLRGNGNSSSADDSLAGLGPDAVPGSGGKDGGGLPGAPGGGAAGGPSLLGGKASPEGADGAAPGPYNTNVISGTTSGGGGSPYARGGGAEGEGNNSSLLGALANKFNLKKYLPGQARGLASTGRDGLTGANGPSIWEKVSIQYNRKTIEMIP